MKKLLRFILPIVIGLSLVLTACTPAATPAATQPPAQPTTAPEPTKAVVQPTQPPAPPPTEKPAEKAKISLWIQYDELGPTGSFTKDIVGPFNAQSKTTEVEVTLQANRWDATRTAMAGGTGPDLVGTPGPSLAAQLARAGYLLPAGRLC